MYNQILISTAREFPLLPDDFVLSRTMTRFRRWQFWNTNVDPLDGHYTKRYNGFHYDGCGIAVPDFVWVGKNGKTLLEMKVLRLERMEQ